jgi:uncharacterized protein (DUF58 family)
VDDSPRAAFARLVPVPTARVAWVAGLLAPAAAFSPWAVVPTLTAINGILVAVAVADAFLAVRPGALRVERDVPEALTLDGQATLRWRVTNPSKRRVRVRLADALVPSLGAADRRATLRLAPGGRSTAHTTIRPSRRGRFELSRVTVRVTGPLGLASRQDTVDVPGAIRVHPAFRSRAEAELRVARAQLLHAGMRLAQGQGGGGEFDRLREYGMDDEFRHIDWAATARTGKAIVRTYRAERNQTVLVLLDSGRTMAGQVAVGDGRKRAGLADASWTVPRLDHAMDATLALALVAGGLGDGTGLVAFADRVRAVVPPRSRPDQLRRISEALYPLQPVLGESDYQQAFGEALTRFRRRALLVVVTELSPEPMEATLVPALPLVLRDHLVVVAGMRDPEVDRWAHAVPAEVSTAYRKAAAVHALEQRRQAASRLRGLGAIVIDEVPGRLAGRLADTYLDIKSTGRL